MNTSLGPGAQMLFRKKRSYFDKLLLSSFCWYTKVASLFGNNFYHLWVKVQVEIFSCCSLRKGSLLESKTDLTKNGLTWRFFLDCAWTAVISEYSRIFKNFSFMSFFWRQEIFPIFSFEGYSSLLFKCAPLF